MNDEFTIKVNEYETNGPDGRVFNLTASISENMFRRYYLAISEGFSKHVVERMTEKWIADNGSQVLEALAPGALADVIRAKVSEALLKNLGMGK